MEKATSPQYEDLLTRALQLSPTERLAMLEELATSLEEELGTPIEWFELGAAYSPEEIAELMKVEPLSPAEIVEQGLLGVWADMNIADGAEWVNEQKRLGQTHIKSQWINERQ